MAVDDMVKEITGKLGEEIDLSDWLEVDQTMINAFAGATQDHGQPASKRPLDAPVRSGRMCKWTRRGPCKMRRAMDAGSKSLSVPIA